ncbi:MAG: hypothetical protein IKY23_12095 [Lachnospiraceae bacterium]|nr:hypothetical protein [Lachnospiraceae bacterium]
MKFPFFASFIVFCAWLGYELHKHRNMERQTMDDFWEREAKANKTRRKSLDSLAYITIPFDTFPMDLLPDDEKATEYKETLRELAKEPIVNLTGITNTELKLTYGAPNIKILSAYDQRYTVLARTLQAFGELLYQKGYLDEAVTVLSFAVSTRTDISATYKLLITLYRELNKEEEIAGLLPVAETLNSGMKNTIVSLIQEAISHT